MSYLEHDASEHDLHLSAAINIVETKYQAILLEADGGLPFRSHIVKRTDNIISYRPDAIMKNLEKYWIVESKSYLDCFTERSLKQFRIINQALNLNKDWNCFVIVFGIPEEAPHNLLDKFDFSVRERVEFFYVDERSVL